jgi:hypothetical protein
MTGKQIREEASRQMTVICERLGITETPSLYDVHVKVEVGTIGVDYYEIVVDEGVIIFSNLNDSDEFVTTWPLNDEEWKELEALIKKSQEKLFLLGF